jgi:hypothetical protein
LTEISVICSPTRIFSLSIVPSCSSTTPSFFGFQKNMRNGFRFFLIAATRFWRSKIITSMGNFIKNVCIPNRVLKYIFSARTAPKSPTDISRYVFKYFTFSSTICKFYHFHHFFAASTRISLDTKSVFVRSIISSFSRSDGL